MLFNDKLVYWREATFNEMMMVMVMVVMMMMMMMIMMIMSALY